MLHGIGGRTIAEAQQSMSWHEVMIWQSYIKERGSLNWGRRIEVGTGQLAYMYSTRHGGKKRPAHFMPHEPRPKGGIPIEKLQRMFGDG